MTTVDHEHALRMARIRDEQRADAYGKAADEMAKLASARTRIDALVGWRDDELRGHLTAIAHILEDVDRLIDRVLLEYEGPAA